jgi:tetratricopeptide (TPR) repeat protein
MQRCLSEGVVPLMISAVVIVSLLVGCGPSRLEQKQSRVHIDMGIAYLKSKRYAPALRELMAAEKLTPKNPEIHYFKGSSYYGNGMEGDAVEEFKKAIALNPDYSEAHNYLGVIYMGKGFYEQALKEFNDALSNILYETPALPLNSMGEIYYKKGEYRMALGKYKEAVRREPQTFLLPLIEKNMGRTALALNDTKTAAYHLEKAVDISPYFVEARYWLGMTYLKEGNRTKAIQELRAAHTIDPHAPFGLKAKECLNDIMKNR